MKTLILAEKPELGRAIEAAVNATERERKGVDVYKRQHISDRQNV